MGAATVTGYEVERSGQVLSPEALAFVAELQRRFAATRKDLLDRRGKRAEEIGATGNLDFLDETAEVRSGAWQVAAAPPDLADRRVEITGPTERKMAINALNSGARVWLADFEDANSPTWENIVAGQVNLSDAVAGALEHVSPEGKHYRVHADTPPAIVMRPRGWHLDERHVLVDDQPVIAALFDFGLYFFNNAKRLVDSGSGPYFYLPKLESHLEARLWNDVFLFAQDALGLPRGTIRATILIETITAAFEMEELLFELREHASGLNAGRWDYLFSIIKNFRSSGDRFVLPDRNAVTMTAPFMRHYTDLLVHTCHKRGAFAIGGMAAFVPNRRDPEATDHALQKVRQDKDREAGDGFDGSWVAHPGLVEVCREAFDAVLGSRPNQLAMLREEVEANAGQLLSIAPAGGAVATLAGLRNNVRVGLEYLEAWLRGQGAVAILNLMEDVATAEIARSQVWQWLHHRVRLDEGTVVDPQLVQGLIADQLASIRDTLGAEAYDGGRWEDARKVFERITLLDDFVEFLTYETYPLID